MGVIDRKSFARSYWRDLMGALEEMDVQERMLLHHEVEQFLFHEARLLDERKFDDWLDLLTDDIHYWMPRGVCCLLPWGRDLNDDDEQ